MGIDGLTVFAQIVNFLILVYLLRRFLYGPIIDAMDRRERSIAARENEARERRAEADAEAEAYRQREHELGDRRTGLLAEAKEAAAALRADLEARARAEVDSEREEWRAALARERSDFLNDVREVTARQVGDIARRALADLASSELEERIARVFLDRLAELDEATVHAMAEGSRRADGRLVVSSAFALAEPWRAAIATAVHEHIGQEVDIDFRVSSQVMCGIELTGGGRRLGWSLDAYLERLDENLATQLADVHAAAPAARQQPDSDPRGSAT